MVPDISSYLFIKYFRKTCHRLVGCEFFEEPCEGVRDCLIKTDLLRLYILFIMQYLHKLNDILPLLRKSLIYTEERAIFHQINSNINRISRVRTY